MQDRILKTLIFIVIVAGFLVYSTFFIVKETQQAIVLQLGEPKKVYKDGWYRDWETDRKSVV